MNHQNSTKSFCNYFDRYYDCNKIHDQWEWPFLNHKSHWTKTVKILIMWNLWGPHYNAVLSHILPYQTTAASCNLDIFSHIMILTKITAQRGVSLLHAVDSDIRSGLALHILVLKAGLGFGASKLQLFLLGYQHHMQDPPLVVILLPHWNVILGI